MRSLTESELYNKNLVKAVNIIVIPVGGYVMNVFRFNKNDLVEIDMVINRELRRKLMQENSQVMKDYLSRKAGRRRIKSLRDV